MEAAAVEQANPCVWNTIKGGVAISFDLRQYAAVVNPPQT
jgi:hypothetical protein